MHPQARPQVQVTIKNSGQTPAYRLIHWAGIQIDDLPLNKNAPPMPAPPHPFHNVLGPGIPEIKTLRMPARLTEDEITGLRNGSKAIYCYGEILYEDAFKKKRRTRYLIMYCYHCGIIGVNTDMIYCERVNDAN
jgi:hypothetical protein